MECLLSFCCVESLASQEQYRLQNSNRNSNLGNLILSFVKEFLYCVDKPGGGRRTRTVQVRWEKPSLK